MLKAGYTGFMWWEWLSACVYLCLDVRRHAGVGFWCRYYVHTNVFFAACSGVFALNPPPPPLSFPVLSPLIAPTHNSPGEEPLTSRALSLPPSFIPPLFLFSIYHLPAGAAVTWSSLVWNYSLPYRSFCLSEPEDVFLHPLHLSYTVKNIVLIDRFCSIFELHTYKTEMSGAKCWHININVT